MTRFWFCGFCLLTTVSYSQDPSMLDAEMVHEDVTLRNRVTALVDSCLKNIDRDNLKALGNIESAADDAAILRDTSIIVSCMRIRGQILYRLSRNDEAIQCFHVALSIAVRNGLKKQQLGILIPYGITLMLQSQYDKALELYFQAQELAMVEKDTSYQESTAHNIGVVYYKLKDYTRALYYWQEALRYEKLLNRRSFELPVNISLCYANLGDLENASRFLNQSVDVCGTGCPDGAMVHIKYASGFINLGLKRYNDAERELLASYRFALAVNDKRMALDNIYLLSDVYAKLGKQEQMFLLLNKAQQIIDAGIPYNMEIIKMYHRFSDLYLQRRDFEKAALYQQRYITLRDSVYNEELTTSLMKTEAAYLEKANVAQIAAQKNVIQLNNTVIDRQRYLNVAACMFMLTLTILIMVSYRNYLEKKSVNVLLESKVKARTLDLENSRSELLEALTERDIIIDRFHRRTYEIDSRIRGLCLTGRNEVTEPVSRFYFDRIYEAIQKAGYSKIR